MGVSEHLQHTDQKSTEVRRSIAVWIAARSRRARFKKREQKEKQRIVEGEKRQRKRRAKKEYRRWLRATRKGKYRSKALGSITNRPQKITHRAIKARTPWKTNFNADQEQLMVAITFLDNHR